MRITTEGQTARLTVSGRSDSGATRAAPAGPEAPAGVRSPLAAPGSAGAQPPVTAPISSFGLIVLLVGLLLPMIDFFIVNVALPTIDGDLHASAGMLQLVVAGYAIAYALLLVVGGRLGDAVGRKRMFLIGIAAFTVTSLLCGLAPSAGVLVGARCAQGAAAALMLPQVLSTIQATTAGQMRARAFGMYGATGGIAAISGQLLGGLLVGANIAGTGWRPIFLVNVPVGVIGWLLAKRLIPETRSPHPAPVDVPGTALLGVAVLALLIPLTEGRSLGWPVWTWILLASVPFATYAFFRVEARSERSGGVPLVPLSVVSTRSMRRGLTVAVPFFTGFGAFMFVYALALQDGAHLSALRTGVALVPMGVGFLAASLSTARLTARYGSRVLTVGAGLQAVGLTATVIPLLSAWPAVHLLALTPGLLVAGIGQGLIMSPLFRLVLADVPPARAGVGSGVLATTQQISLAFGVATLGSVFLTLASPIHLGAQGAFGLVLAVLVVNACLVGLLTLRLPD